jgi:uncharacterized repeat protein (TIGR03803 family)
MASASLVGAQTLQTLCFFNGTNGAHPYAALTLGTDGNFYGTTSQGGRYGEGTVFKITTNGTVTTLVSFNGSNGADPWATLTLGPDGNFYGTTLGGGITNFFGPQGTVFKVTPNGMLTTLVFFNCNNGDGDHPISGLTLGSDGNFYGATVQGGSEQLGTVFEMTTNGTLTTLFSFYSTPDGENPRAALTLGPDGNFYGTTSMGGSGGNSGTVFKVTTNGMLTTLVSFNGNNGYNPQAALTLGNDSNFYGTTQDGGSGYAGTVFQVTINGTLTTLVSFNGTNGTGPNGLTLGPDGNFYGTAFEGGSGGGSYSYGTIFMVTTNGTLNTLYSFSGTNGAYPYAGLTLGNDGNFYGTTVGGGITNSQYTGDDGMGTVFRLLPPPVIIVQPQSQTNNVGATMTFLVSAASLYPMSFQWQKNGTNLVDGGNLSGAATNILTITGISDSDVAVYSVIVSNANGRVTSSNAMLTVNDLPFIVSQPQSQIVLAGSNVIFNVSVYGEPPFVFQWYYNNSPVGSPTSGTNVSSYTLTNVHTNQSGNYRVQVINGYGSVTSSNATLTVVLPPIITTQPTNCTNNATTTATFSVVASSSLPLNFQWQKNGTNLVDGGNISGSTTNNLTIANVSDADVANYQVVVSHAYGSVTSSNVTLTVIDPPVISVQPLCQRILLGSSVSFNPSVSGTAPLHYQWRFNSANLLNATNATYAIQAVAATNTGNYSVVITNLAGSVTSSNALLTVIVPPTLALQIWAGYPVLNLDGMLSNNFVVEYSTNLADTNWIILLSLTNLSDSPYLFLDPAGVDQPARFYRVFMQ